MRNAFAQEVTTLAGEDPRVVLLSGDIGNRLFDPLKAVAPDQFLNCGIAEANMMGMASGMALSGLRPVVYTITAFATLRCIEQIRVDVCYHKAPVILVGVGSGLSYASLNATHQSCEDIACLRTLPNMTIITPADPAEVRGALRMAHRWDGPVYIRLGKKGEKPVHGDVPAMRPGGSVVVREGKDICLLGVGLMVRECLEAADLLASDGISAQVVSLYSVKPLDEAMLTEAFGRFKLVASVEEHSRIGGAGGAIAEWLVEDTHRALPASFLRFGTRDAYLHETTHTAAARRRHGIDAVSIAGGVRQRLAVSAETL